MTEDAKQRDKAAGLEEIPLQILPSPAGQSETFALKTPPPRKRRSKSEEGTPRPASVPPKSTENETPQTGGNSSELPQYFNIGDHNFSLGSDGIYRPDVAPEQHDDHGWGEYDWENAAFIGHDDDGYWDENGDYHYWADED